MLERTSGMNKVDRAYALATMPRPRQSRFPAAGGVAVLDVLERRAEGTILPRRLTLSDDAGSRITMLLRRRRLVGIAEVAPPALWSAGTPLPAPVEDDETGDALAEAAAAAIAKVLDGTGEVDIRMDFPQPGDATSGEGLTFDAVTETLGALLPDGGRLPDRPTLLTRFYDAMTDMPRVMLAPERRIDLPDATPPAVARLFGGIGPAHVKHKPGDAPDILLFEQGKSGNALTVKVADEDRLCLVHAATPARAEVLLAATWQLKRSLDRAAAPGPGDPLL